MARRAYIGDANNVARKMTKGYIGIKPNLVDASKPIMSCAGYCAASDSNTKVVINYAEAKDTYFWISLAQTIAANKQYTVSFDCTGVDDETQIIIKVLNSDEYPIRLTNGRLSKTFISTAEIGTLLMDDRQGELKNVIGKEIILSNFRVEEYDGVGVANRVKKIYTGIGGVARPCWSIEGVEYWGTAAELNEPRNYLAATTVGNHALFAGGLNGVNGTLAGHRSTVDAYDISLTKSTPTELSVARYLLSAATVGNYALFAGGQNGGSSVFDTVDAYDVSLTRSTPTALSRARRQLGGTAVGNYALFGGGITGSDYLNTVDAYDVSLTRSTPTALNVARNSLAAATVGNHALFAGGQSSVSTKVTRYDTVDAYDESLTRSTPTALSVARRQLGATAVGNYALFGGGEADNGYTDAVDAYDESLTRSTPMTLSKVRSQLAAVGVGNYALFGGGRGTDGHTDVVDAYDNLLTKSVPAPLSEGRYGLAAVTTGSRALFGGGHTVSTGEDPGWRAIVDVYVANE